jgi:hypothetical protein
VALSQLIAPKNPLAQHHTQPFLCYIYPEKIERLGWGKFTQVPRIRESEVLGLAPYLQHINQTKMKLIKYLIFFFISMMALTSISQVTDDKAYIQEQQLPEWFLLLFKEQKLEDTYKLSDYINPFYLEGDFNGDGQIDIAVLIEEKQTSYRGILICHGLTKKYFVLGAGINFGNGDDHFGWMDIWKVYREKKVEVGVGETQPITLKSDAIWVEKSESASAIIYWTGQNFKWYQQGD